MTIKCCSLCNKDITFTKQRKYCLDCAYKVRREKDKGYRVQYLSTRDPEILKNLRNKLNNKRNLMRQDRKIKGLCYECVKVKENIQIILCDKCSLKSRVDTAIRQRKKGVELRGQSRHQKFINNIVCEIFQNLEVTYNNMKMLRSPLTNAPLELDIYIPKYKIGIEVDGPMHREPIYGEERLQMQIRNDGLKDQLCKEQNIKLIRINTDDIDFNDDRNIRDLLILLFKSSAM